MGRADFTNQQHLLCAPHGSSHVLACMLSHFSHVQLYATPWTVACQAPLSIGFSRQEYWRGLPFLSQEDHPNLGIEPESLTSPAALAGGFFTTNATWEASQYVVLVASVVSHSL